MTKPLISIIVPAYNIEAYVKKTLDSIFAQTYENIEVVAVNDGSKDGTGAILDAYAVNETRLHIIHKENAGVNKARIDGIKAANGEYIGFVDGDDLTDSDMYERLYNNAEKYNADISHCGYRMIYSDGSEKYFYNTQNVKIQSNEDGTADLLRGEFIEPGLCNKLFRRNLFEKAFNNSSMIFNSYKENEDLLMNYLLFKEAKNSIYEDFCPYRYLIRSTSASHGRVNKNILLDPIAIGEFLVDDTQDADETVKMLAARYYVVKLIKAAAMSYRDCRDLLPIRKTARKKLRTFSKKYFSLKNESAKRKLLCAFAAYFPPLYTAVHSVYSK